MNERGDGEGRWENSRGGASRNRSREEEGTHQRQFDCRPLALMKDGALAERGGKLCACESGGEEGSGLAMGSGRRGMGKTLRKDVVRIEREMMKWEGRGDGRLEKEQ